MKEEREKKPCKENRPFFGCFKVATTHVKGEAEGIRYRHSNNNNKKRTWTGYT